MVFARDDWAAGMDKQLAAALKPIRCAKPAKPANPSRIPVHISDQTELSPEQLAERCQAGCAASFEQLVLLFEARVFNFLHQLTHNRHDAEDLTQITFLKVYRSLPRYKPSLAFAPWIFSIARRTAASHFRSAEHLEELPIDGEATEATPANLLASKDEQDAVWRLARTLKPKQWEALWLRYGEDFSIAEIATVMRTNQIHIKVLLHRARTKLAKLLVARELDPAAVSRKSSL